MPSKSPKQKQKPKRQSSADLTHLPPRKQVLHTFVRLDSAPHQGLLLQLRPQHEKTICQFLHFPRTTMISPILRRVSTLSALTRAVTFALFLFEVMCQTERKKTLKNERTTLKTKMNKSNKRRKTMRNTHTCKLVTKKVNKMRKF